MEDDGPGCAHSREHGAAEAGHVRAARRGRMGLGDGQGDRLADLHHPDPRLHPRSRLLPDGVEDGRPGRPGLVADQPLPAREPDPPVPGAGRGDRPVGGVADRARSAGGRGPTAPSSSSARGSSTSAGPTARPRSPRSMSPRRSAPATSTRGRPGRRSPSRGPTSRPRSSRAASTSWAARAPTASRPRRPSS